MKKSAILLGYIQSRLLALLLFAVQFAVLFLLCNLYGLPMAPILYTTLIMCVCIIFFGALDFWNYYQDIRQLERYKKQASTHIAVLPKPADLQKALLRQILNQLEDRCQQVSEKAKQQEAATTQYYTIWSHQAKTPLAAMRLLLQEDEPNRSALKLELFKAEQYVDMALQYQRLSISSPDLVLRKYSIEPIIKQAVKEVSTLFIHKKISIFLGNLNGTVLTDKKWMLFVLEQLLTNAVKYTPKGTVSIWCEDRMLFLKDTGIGITPEDLPRIFEWGFTGYNGHGETRSTGVGLSLCKMALTMLGHTITIQSEVGQGTMVAIDLSRKDIAIE